MSTQFPMFDRQVLLKAIQRHCLGQGGSSMAIVASHKVGKTHLLNHISSTPREGRESLFCKIDLDSLRAFASKDEALSDHVFMRFFLLKLLEQIDLWIEALIIKEDTLNAEMDEAEGRLKGLKQMPPGSGIQQMCEEQERLIEARKRELRELEGLKEVKEEIRTRIDQEQPLQTQHVVYVFNKLKLFGKRIILMIDDFNEMLKEPGFTYKLFSFLRGANNEGKITPVVCSSVQLMDASLHPPTDSNDRISLFNSFQMQFLEPFSAKEADDFLCWCVNDEAPLSEEEKAYLQELGGGSPHFLKLALDQFLQKDRPATESERQAFEKKYVSEYFAPAFRQILDRCNTDDRATLCQVAEGNDPGTDLTYKLERDGYLVRDPLKIRLFSRLLTDYMTHMPKAGKSKGPALAATSKAADEHGPGWELAQLDVSVEIPDIVPTALFFAYPEYSNLVTLKLKNLVKGLRFLQVECQVMEYSDRTHKTEEIQAEGRLEKSYGVTFRRAAMERLKATTAAQVDYKITLKGAGGDRELRHDTKTVRLLPPDNFIMARWDPAQKVIVDFTWLITAWVKTEDKSLKEIRKRARVFEPSVGDRDPTKARDQVGAIYKALQEQQIGYDDSNLVFHQSENDYVQRVRFPVESLKDNIANCLDGSVLFASLLSMCGLDPLILLVPGHALVGWKDRTSDPPKARFLETTRASTQDFIEACKIGEAEYEKVKDTCCSPAKDVSLHLNPKEFALVIDVHQVWQDRKVLSLLGH